MSSRLMVFLLAASVSAPWAATAQVRTLTRVALETSLRVEYQTRAGSAMERWESAVASNTTASEEWDSIGRALYQAGQYRESVAAFERGLKLRVEGSSESAWYIARAYAQLGNRKQALRWLTHAWQLGFRDVPAMGKEPAFEKYRTDTQFRALVRPSMCWTCRTRANVDRAIV